MMALPSASFFLGPSIPGQGSPVWHFPGQAPCTHTPGPLAHRAFWVFFPSQMVPLGVLLSSLQLEGLCLCQNPAT